MACPTKLLLSKTRYQLKLVTFLKPGLLAYADGQKFPDGPWCQEGDWVIFASDMLVLVLRLKAAKSGF